jgi:2-keto-4-pentenoate hydratase/2-oxohepta-3-ene-1,7-dioic acid hydratase in catechol pathway
VTADVAPGRIWVVLGGFVLPDNPVVPAGTLPRLVPKVVRAVSGDGGEIACPPATAGAVCVEGELALVIGREVHAASRAEAAAAILGYTCFNDVTAMEQLAQGEWSMSKSWDTFASMGPRVTTALGEDRIKAGLAIVTRVNGAEVQRGDTRYYKFLPADIVQYLSTYVTLLPGDIISLGTPPPAAPVQPGDAVEIEVEQVGVLHNVVVAAPPTAGPG